LKDADKTFLVEDLEGEDGQLLYEQHILSGVELGSSQ